MMTRLQLQRILRKKVTVAMIQNTIRRQQTSRELSSGLVVNERTTCVHEYTVPTPNASVAPMKCTQNTV